MLARGEDAAGELVVRGDRRRDQNGLECRIAEELVKVRRSADARVASCDSGPGLLALVADPDELGEPGLDEVPNELRAPVPEADDANSDRLRHRAPWPRKIWVGVRASSFRSSASDQPR